MNYEERKNFWNLLCSLIGDDIVADKDALIKAIKYPKFLYRYRPVNINNLEALRTNKLYFSSANYYDDPFDTFLHIDINTYPICYSDKPYDATNFAKLIMLHKLEEMAKKHKLMDDLMPWSD